MPYFRLRTCRRNATIPVPLSQRPPALPPNIHFLSPGCLSAFFPLPVPFSLSPSAPSTQLSAHAPTWLSASLFLTSKSNPRSNPTWRRPYTQTAASWMGRCIYIPTTPSLIEGSLIPQGQRPCVCGSQPFERFWVPGFLDYQYLSLLARLFLPNSSCTPTFFPLPPPLTLPRPTVGTNRHHLLSFSFLFSFHCCDALLYTKERTFFVYQPVYQWWIAMHLYRERRGGSAHHESSRWSRNLPPTRPFGTSRTDRKQLVRSTMRRHRYKDREADPPPGSLGL